MYEYLQKYKVNQEFEQNNLPCVFYPVTEKEIEDAQKNMNLSFPNELKTFWREIGHGYFEDSDELWLNHFMKTQEIADFICGKGDYFYSEEREFLPKDHFVFFELESNLHLTISPTGAIYRGKQEIASDLPDFIKRMHDVPNYFFL